MLTLWVFIGSFKTLASHLVAMRPLVDMSHPEAGWQRHAKMPGYPMLDLAPISVHVVFGCLWNISPFKQQHLARSHTLLGATCWRTAAGTDSED